MKPWKILVVDDDGDVLKSTVYTLEDQIMMGAGLEIVTARSASAAEEILEFQRDFAVLIIDVSMEKPNAGLNLVDRVRLRYGMDVARILLRTGQPGDLMQKKAVSVHEINDYIEKSTSDRWRVENAVLTSIRAYVQLVKYKRLQSGLKAVLEFSSNVLAKEQVSQIALSTISVVDKVFGRRINAAFGFQGKTTSLGDVDLTVLASVGEYAPPVEVFGAVMREGTWPHKVKESMQFAIDGVGQDQKENSRTIVFHSAANRLSVLWLQDEDGFDQTDQEIIDFLTSSLRGILDRWSMLRNRMMETTLSMGILAHEFRTPIASLRMTNEFLQDAVTNGTLDKDQAQHMLSNVDQILTGMTAHIDRSIENVRVVVKKSVSVLAQKKDIGHLVREVLSMHKMVFSAAGELETHIFDSAYAMVDQTTLEQVIVNLLSNASKAVLARTIRARGPQITVSVALKGEKVEISITDQGVGMNKEKLAKIFDPFYSSNEMPSHGLGLTMVKKSLEAMGSEISCTSTFGVGTTFKVTFPAETP